MNGSQRSSLFPWDNAGASSSNGNAADAGLPGSENFVDHVDVRLRSNSLSHRDSSIVPSQRGSILIGGIGFSPVLSGRGSQVIGELDFAFDGVFIFMPITRNMAKKFLCSRKCPRGTSAGDPKVRSESDYFRTKLV